MRAAFLSIAFAGIAAAQSFTAASIRPSAQSVNNEHDGKTDITPGLLTMRDVLVTTCIEWAYGVQQSQITGPEWIGAEDAHFDIQARADEGATLDEMKAMMKALLKERFGLEFHREPKEITAYAMTIAKSGPKMKEAAPDEKMERQNSAIGTMVKAMTMAEWGDFIAGPLRMPVVDQTGLTGRYDFQLDFTPYLPGGEHVMKVDFDNTNGIILAAMQDQMGIKLESRKLPVQMFVVDKVQKPSAN